MSILCQKDQVSTSYLPFIMIIYIYLQIAFCRNRQNEAKMDFTIREENVRLLQSSTAEIEKRFNTRVTIEETTYAPSEKQTLRWVQLRGKDEPLAKCAKVTCTIFL